MQRPKSHRQEAASRAPTSESDDVRRVVVSLDDSAINDPVVWKSTIQRLQSSGLQVGKELNVVGVVSGSAVQSKLKELRKQPHVVGVEFDQQRSVQ